MLWRYEFIATRVNRAGSIVIDDGEFRAKNVEDAQALLHSVARNIKSRNTRPDALRLVDASGQEVMRVRLVADEGERKAVAG